MKNKRYPKKQMNFKLKWRNIKMKKLKQKIN